MRDISHIFNGYDLQYRTSSIVVGSLMSQTYTYDANGNVASFVDTEPLASDENAGLYTYQQATNKLMKIQGELNVVYGYDANGNITSANNRTFTYDLSNRLIMVQDDGVTIAQYVYNALNQRINKILTGETRIFHYDLQGHLIAETSTSGSMLAEYIYLGDKPLAMIGPTETVYYFHNDHLGTPQILTDDTGTVSWKAVYTPFGEAEISIAMVENNIRFPGQYYDQETGLHYNYHRYYDPKLGRYLTPDPIGLEGGINLFVYVASNPLRFFDVNGLVVTIDPSCPAEKRAEIEQGITRVSAEASKCLPNSLKSEVQTKLDNLVVTCDDRQDCCGHAPQSGNRITISPSAFTVSCGCLESTILHEVIHTTGRDEDTSSGCEVKCFACAVKHKGADPCNCK